MKKTMDAVKAFFEKRPLLSGTIKTMLSTFAIASVTMAVIFLLLWLTGIYPRLQTVLDLKFNSPVLLTIIFVFAALFLVCWTVGTLMYFHKYRRSKTKTAFYKGLVSILNK